MSGANMAGVSPIPVQMCGGVTESACQGSTSPFSQKMRDAFGSSPEQPINPRLTNHILSTSADGYQDSPGNGRHATGNGRHATRRNTQRTTCNTPPRQQQPALARPPRP
jgi:hypothetical protein